MERRSLSFLILVAFGALICVSCSQNDSRLASLEQVLPAPSYRHVTLKVTDYCPADGQTARSLFALNASARVKNDVLIEDFDRDGVPNIFEGNPLTGTDYLHADTNNDGYGDLLMVTLGMTVTSQISLTGCTNPALDADSDGLNDCEEALLGLNKNRADTDGDGIPDLLELRAGLNALDGTDAIQDPDGDGLSNLEEVRLNTPPYEHNEELTKQFELSYALTPKTIGGRSCFDHTASNVTLANVPNGNLIRFFFLESDSLGNVSLRQGRLLVPANSAEGLTIERPFQDLQ